MARSDVAGVERDLDVFDRRGAVGGLERIAVKRPRLDRRKVRGLARERHIGVHFALEKLADEDNAAFLDTDTDGVAQKRPVQPGS